MRKSNKFFLSGLIIVLVSSVIVGIMTRLSIEDNSYLGKYISFSEGTNYKLSLQEDDNFTRIYFDNNISNIKELEDKSDVVIKVKVTPKREVFSQAVRTKVEVLDVYKSDTIKEHSEIYIYEPSYFISNQYISMGGYNIMEEDKEYVFFLKNLTVPNGYKYKNDEEVSFIPVSTLYSKFSFDGDNKISTIPQDDIDREEVNYNQIRELNIITTRQEVINKYEDLKKSLSIKIN